LFLFVFRQEHCKNNTEALRSRQKQKHLFFSKKIQLKIHRSTEANKVKHNIIYV